MACAAPDPHATRSYSAPAPLHDRQTGENQRSETRIRAQPGQQVVLNRWFALRADCSLQDYFRVQAVFAPEHGQLSIRHDRAAPRYPADNPRAACDAAPQDGIGAFYTPSPGWHGADTMTLRIEAPSGKSWTTDYVITTG